MEHDMEAAKNGSLQAEKGIVHEEENTPGISHDISPEKALPAEEKKLILEPADESDDIIKDDYIGNVSYKMLKDSKEKLPAVGENAKPDAAFPDKPDAGSSDIKTFGTEEETERKEERKIFSYREDMKSITGHIPFEADAGSEIEEQKNLRRSAADIKREIMARLGRRGVAIALAVVLLAGGTLYALWSRQSAEEAAMNGNAAANLPPVKEDVSKIADSNDAIRISNLTTLANVAVLYYIKQGADLPISRSYIKLNESNPVTDFLRDALRRYGQSEDIMHDPRHPDFYYAYRSADGNSIEFTARLEDSGSSSQCKNEDVCVYRKILAEEDIDNMSDHIERYEP